MEQVSTDQVEQQRLENLASYSILDTLPEGDYDAITKIAAEICATPISLVSLIDSRRQWFKSRQGLEATETNRDVAFCAHAIKTPEKPLIISDARLDERFVNNPLVTGELGIVFYAGFPLISSEGYGLGTLCVIDTKVRELSTNEIESLSALSRQVVRLLDLRKKSEQLENANFELSEFAKLVAHDIKGPLASIRMTADRLKSDIQQGLTDKSLTYLNMISNSSSRLSKLVDTLLVYYTEIKFNKAFKTTIKLSDLVTSIEEILCIEKNIKIKVLPAEAEIYVNEPVLKQILLNLFSNSNKYNDKKNIEISISVTSIEGGGYEFNISDNGIGIEAQNLNNVFDIFTTHGVSDRFGNKGTGIGLAAIKKLIESTGGKITVKSLVGVGSKFTFSFF